MHNMFKTKTFFALCLLAVPVLGAAQQRASSGPIESISLNEPSISVLGQTYSITSATKFAINGRAISIGSGLRRIAASQIAYVEGMDTATGSIATSIDIAPDMYVAGATTVYVYGPVAELNPSVGLLRVGQLRVDISAIAPEDQPSLQIGSAVEVSGIQPVPGGTLITPDLLSIGGSGTLRVADSGVQSIGGSGIQSIGGSGIQSIGGSGIQSIGGSGIQSIGGSDIQSIGGSGMLSIGGSGAF